jgi:two-component system CheB/CheR fusion protein
VSNVIDGVVITLEDATQRKDMENQIASSQATYQDLYDAAPVMLLCVDAATEKIIRCNATVVLKTGYTKDEIVGRSVFDLYDPKCREKARATFQSFLQTGEVRGVQLAVKRKDGSALSVVLDANAVRDDDGTVIRSRSSWREAP